MSILLTVNREKKGYFFIIYLNYISFYFNNSVCKGWISACLVTFSNMLQLSFTLLARMTESPIFKRFKYPCPYCTMKLCGNKSTGNNVAQ